MNRTLLAFFFSLVSGIPLLWAQGRDTAMVIEPIAIEKKTVTIYAEIHEPDRRTATSFSTLQSKAWEPLNFGQEPSFLLSRTPGVTFVSDAGSYAGYSYFRLRGIDQTRINVNLNGVPMNEPEDMGIYFSNFPDLFNSLSKVQVQRGVGLGTSGNAALGGAIHLHSSPRIEDAPLKLNLNYGSYNTMRASLESQAPFAKKHNGQLYARGSWIQSDGYKNRSGNQSQSLFLNSSMNFGSHYFEVLGFAGNQANQMAWLGVPLDSIEQNPRYNPHTEEDDHFTQAHGQLRHKFWKGNTFRMTNKIYYTFLDGNYDFDLNNFLGFPPTSEMYNYAFRSNWLGGGSEAAYLNGPFEFQGGLNAYTYQRDHIGSERALGELYQNTGRKDEFSGFLRMIVPHSILQRWQFSAEAQYRMVGFSYDGAVPLPDQHWNFLNYKGGLSFELDINSHLYYSFGSTHREPSRLDMFYGWDDLQADSLGNPVYAQIEPEQVFDHELGWRFRNRQLYVNANLYFMQFRNEIALNGAFGPSGLPLHSNVAKTVRSGLELDAKWEIPRTKVVLTHTSAFSRNRTTEAGESFEPILTPSVILNQGIKLNFNDKMIGLEARYQNRAWLDWGNTAELPAYVTLNLFASYKWKMLEGTLRLNNLTNTRYYGGGYLDYDGTPLYFIQAPFNFMAGLSVTIGKRKELPADVIILEEK